jgi:CRP-like cAMP-binding protein
LKEITIKKGTVLQRKGEPSTKAFMVQSGLLRSYTVDEKGKEHVFMFAPEGWIVADVIDHGKPAELTIDALEDSVLVVESKEIDIKDFPVEPLLRRLSVLQKRVMMLMSSSAIVRYQHFVETYPDIIQRVPQRIIASYLGVTPEALSRAKAQYLKNGGPQRS